MRDPGTNTWTRLEAGSVDADDLPPTPFDALSDPSIDDLLPGGLGLWPRGAAWGSPDGLAPRHDTVLAGLTRAILSAFAGLYVRAWDLTLESRAVTMSDSIADWERDYGLPDACSNQSQTSDGRRRALLSRVRSASTITPQDFVQLAFDEGFNVEIEEPAMFECGFSEVGGEHTVGDIRQEVYWIVHIYDLAVNFFRVGESEVGRDPLFEVVGSDRLECLFRRYVPAWTQPVYVVHDPA